MSDYPTEIQKNIWKMTSLLGHFRISCSLKWNCEWLFNHITLKWPRWYFCPDHVLIHAFNFYNGLTTTGLSAVENFNRIFLPLRTPPTALSACGAGSRRPPLVGLPLSPPVFQRAVLLPNSKTWRVLHRTWQTDCQSLVWTPLQKSSPCDHENWQVYCLKNVKRLT